jgi:hypothetical protein
MPGRAPVGTTAGRALAARRVLRWVLGLVTLALAAIAVTAVGVPAADAHPIPPGYDSRIPSPITISVDSIAPNLSPDAFIFEPTSGLAELSVSAQAGHDVVVLGYDGEPYLHVDAQSHTFQNASSPSTYLNSTTQGGDTVPASASPTAAPRWEPLPTAGTVTWHDHRVHWMQPDPPSTDAGSDVVDHWQVKLIVDGTPVDVDGTLHYHADIPWSDYQIAVGTPTPPPSSWGRWLAIAGVVVVLVGIGGWLLLVRGNRRRAARARAAGPGRARPPADGGTGPATPPAAPERDHAR